ncbi:substrate-binding domain-containing protein [Clostridium sp. SHJSY1]|uniref:substrate-binding domain-containing protein n=1 Tax=Clostridium sp. SHJSY1 TaxID=2942483 RepID=UPI002874DB55|nr:substrate-binding domain-containing protein [Clostridium sp. SHJSY1]MDS0527161.1 substrate-binding domain-containing protein [Clostridium sp. SHJSY1]
MKFLKKLLIFIMIILMIFTLTSNENFTTSANTNFDTNNRKTYNIAILFTNLRDPFFALTKENLINIQNENKDKVNFIFLDSQNNESIENELINYELKRNVDLLAISMINPNEKTLTDVIERAKQKNIPIILLGIPTDIVSKVSSIYSKAAFIIPNSEQAGMAEGNILADLWNTKKNSLDKNNDNILSYIILQGILENEVTLGRTKGFILALTNSGIKIKELEHINANWSEDTAKISIENLLRKYNDKIEAIISNNDSMALGAIEALQKYGYNTGDMTKYIPVLGIDGLPEVKALIDKGFMTGTVIQPPRIFADQIYLVGMNLLNNLNPIANTNYEFKNNQIVAIFPIETYTKKN